MSKLGRFVEDLLRPWDNEDTELILRWRLWKSRWFPYRTAELIEVDGSFFDEENNLNTGPWKWHAPDAWTRRKK